MIATTKRTSSRKTASKKPTLTAEEKDYLDTLSPKHRKLHLLARQLEGKLTKALAIK